MKKTRGPTRRFSINYENIYGKGKTPNDERIKKLKSQLGTFTCSNCHQNHNQRFKAYLHSKIVCSTCYHRLKYKEAHPKEIMSWLSGKVTKKIVRRKG